FTGGPAEAERALTLGTWLSFSGIVSFKTAEDLRAAAALTPADRLLVETDAPFLAPVPHRGKTNEPAFLPAVGAALAAARDETVVLTVAVALRLGVAAVRRGGSKSAGPPLRSAAMTATVDADRLARDRASRSSVRAEEPAAPTAVTVTHDGSRRDVFLP